MSEQLPGVFQSLAPLLDRHGYQAVIVLVGVEGFGIPFPGQTILIAAGLYAATGQLNLVAVLTLGLLAAVVGDNIGYAIGRCGGRRLVVRFGRFVFLSEARVAAAERFFARRGTIVVPTARFVERLRQANGIAAGIVQMAWLRFVLYNALGAIAWVGVWVFVGYWAGDHITAIYAKVERYQNHVLAAVAVIGLALAVRWVLKRRSRRRGSAELAGSLALQTAAERLRLAHAKTRADARLRDPAVQDGGAGSHHHAQPT
ncbi:MAG: DedA family protein [Mycobacterium sp.]